LSRFRQRRLRYRLETQRRFNPFISIGIPTTKNPYIAEKLKSGWTKLLCVRYGVGGKSRVTDHLPSFFLRGVRKKRTPTKVLGNAFL